MDPLTHAATGAAFAGALRDRLPPRAGWLMALLAVAPDADYLLRFVSDTVYLRYHRGVTHSLLLLPLWTWLAYALMPKARARYPLLPWAICVVLLLHILLDLLTSFGTMIFAPISDARFAWDLVFIIDPLFTALILLPWMASLVWRRFAQAFCRGALAAGVAYVCVCSVIHDHALAIARNAHPQAKAVYALPYPFSPFHWQLIAAYPNRFERTYVDLWPGFPGSSPFFPKSFTSPYLAHLRPPQDLAWQGLERMAENDIVPGVRFYRWFARFPVLLKDDGKRIEYGDLRFGAGQFADSPFRLLIERGSPGQAWLIWRGERKTLLGGAQGRPVEKDEILP